MRFRDRILVYDLPSWYSQVLCQVKPNERESEGGVRDRACALPVH